MMKTFVRNGTTYRVETVTALRIPRDQCAWKRRQALLIADVDLEKEEESGNSIRWANPYFVVFGFRMPKTNSAFSKLFDLPMVGEYGSDEIHEMDDCIECIDSVRYVE